MNNFKEAREYFERAKVLAIPQAENALIEVSKNRNIIKMTNNN